MRGGDNDSLSLCLSVSLSLCLSVSLSLCLSVSLSVRGGFWGRGWLEGLTPWKSTYCAYEIQGKLRVGWGLEGEEVIVGGEGHRDQLI